MLEGGDFVSYSRDLCFIGVGIRTNMEAVQYLMQHDLLGTRRVAVVVDALDRNQSRMHLDTVFNVVGTPALFVRACCSIVTDTHTALLLEEAMGRNAMWHRTVHEYTRNARTQQYEPTPRRLSEYLHDNIPRAAVPLALQQYPLTLHTGGQRGTLIGVAEGLRDLVRQRQQCARGGDRIQRRDAHV